MTKTILLTLTLAILTGCALFDKGKDKLKEEKDEWLADHNFGENEPEEAAAFPESVPNNGADISAWPQTCTIGPIVWGGIGVNFPYTDEGDRDSWPILGGGDLNGHLVILVKGPDGKWHVFFADSLRRKGKNGWDSQTLKPFKTHGNLAKPPIAGWAIKPGEKIGLCVVSGGWYLGGGGKRSNVQWTTYPY